MKHHSGLVGFDGLPGHCTGVIKVSSGCGLFGYIRCSLSGCSGRCDYGCRTLKEFLAV